MNAKEFLKEKGIDQRTIESLNLVQILEEYASQSRWIFMPIYPDDFKGKLVLLPTGGMTIGIKLFDEDKFVQQNGEDFPESNQPIAWQPLPPKP